MADEVKKKKSIPWLGILICLFLLPALLPFLVGTLEASANTLSLGIKSLTKPIFKLAFMILIAFFIGILIKRAFKALIEWGGKGAE